MRCIATIPRSWSAGAPGLGSIGGGGVRRVPMCSRRPARDVTLCSMAPIGRRKGKRASTAGASQPVATQDQQKSTDPLQLLAELVAGNRPGPKSIEEVAPYNRALVETVNDRVSSAFLEVTSELGIAAAELPSSLQSFEDEVRERALVEAVNDRVSSALLDAASELSIAAAELPITLQGFEEEVEARAQAYMRNAPVSAPAARKSSASSVQAASSMAGDEAVMADPVKGTQETIDELQAELAESRSIINALKNVKAA